MKLPDFWRSLRWVLMVIIYAYHELAFTLDINWVYRSAKKENRSKKGEGLEIRRLW
ncbi:hypothetical protein NC653_027658 [Populus alba x Populus x berolinensis]|uniref:Uncharacterized protein n=1 Tax=Populus alba x Populus x berolinensis TaxID=444605 RepID=A0AAD6M5W8_9ROSI|nr:hypothetical protein NC653_027658 [Populus alba x Populus x berolinensis]